MAQSVSSAGRLNGEVERYQGRKDEGELDGINRATENARRRSDMVEIIGSCRTRSLRMWKVGMGQSKGNFERFEGPRSRGIGDDQRWPE